MDDVWLNWLGRWVAKLVKRLLKSRHLSKLQNGRNRQRSGQHTLARQKYIKSSNISVGVGFRVKHSKGKILSTSPETRTGLSCKHSSV
jgi:hypothetical protein